MLSNKIKYSTDSKQTVWQERKKFGERMNESKRFIQQCVCVWMSWCSMSANASILCIRYIDYVQMDRCEYCNVSDSEWTTSVCTFPNFVEEHTSPCGIEFGIRLDALIGAYSGTTSTRYYINRWSAWNSLHHNYFGIMSTASIIVMHSDTLSRWLTCICEQRNFLRYIECKT